MICLFNRGKVATPIVKNLLSPCYQGYTALPWCHFPKINATLSIEEHVSQQFDDEADIN